MSSDQAHDAAVSILTQNFQTASFKGTVLRMGSFTVDGVTSFVFTIQKSTGESEVMATAPFPNYFQTLLETDEGSEQLFNTLLTYASQVKVGEQVDVIAAAHRGKQIIYFIEPEPLSAEKARELDRT